MSDTEPKLAPRKLQPLCVQILLIASGQWWMSSIIACSSTPA